MIMELRRGLERAEPIETSPEKIVADILAEVTIQPEKKRSKIKYLLNYGSKVLTLSYDLRDQSYLAVLETDRPEDHLPNETTLLYTAAKKLMDTKANSLGQAVRYSLITENPSLIKWAESTGDNIFHWDSTWTDDRPESEGGSMAVFNAEIAPLPGKQGQKRRLAA